MIDIPSPHTMSRIFRKISGKSFKPQDQKFRSEMPYNSSVPKLSSQGNSLRTTEERSGLTSAPEPPPAYTSAPLPTSQNRSVDSPYAFLQQFDTVFIIDDSGSMAGRSWRETARALAAITPICTEQDADGVDIYFLNHRNPYTADPLGGYKNVTSMSAVEEIFRNVDPGGGTPTGSRLHRLLRPYIEDVAKAIQQPGRFEIPKPRNIIVITDGCASDDPEAVIVQAAKRLDQLNAEPWQIGIQFFQVGHELDAAQELRDLDDALSWKYGIRDMVDTVPWDGVSGATLSAESIMKVTMGAVNRRLDRKQVSNERS